MVEVYTAQYSYRGSDRLDTTVKTSDKTFAPTWDMVWGHKNGILSNDDYTKLYVSMMVKSYRENREKWDEILNKDRITLICFCSKGKFCHRVILAKIFRKLGADYKGEV